MNKDERIKELEKVSMQLYNMVHDSDLIDNKIKANELYDIIVKKLTLTDVSSMFSAKQMEQAFNDGVEAEQQRCGEFNIENYC